MNRLLPERSLLTGAHAGGCVARLGMAPTTPLPIPSVPFPNRVDAAPPGKVTFIEDRVFQLTLSQHRNTSLRLRGPGTGCLLAVVAGWRVRRDGTLGPAPGRPKKQGDSTGCASSMYGVRHCLLPDHVCEDAECGLTRAIRSTGRIP